MSDAREKLARTIRVHMGMPDEDEDSYRSLAEDILAAHPQFARAMEPGMVVVPDAEHVTDAQKVAGGLAMERELFELGAPVIFDAMPTVYAAMISAAQEGASGGR